MAEGIYPDGEGKWILMYDAPRGPDGKRNQKRQHFKGTKRQAEAERRRILRDIDTGTYLEPSRLTVAEHLDRWLRDYAAPTVGAKTFEDYETVIRKHLVPALGRLPLEKLRSLEIQRLYREKQEEGLSASRVRLIHIVLHQALDKALKGRLLHWNPMDGVEPPGPPKHRTTDVYDADQVNALLAQSRKSSIHMLILLGVHTGARLGELCALQWADVDLESGTLYIHQSLTHTQREGLQFKSTKSGDSRRIKLAPDAVTELRRHKAEQAQRRLLLGSFWQDHGLVCPKDDGTPRHPDQASKTFHDFIRRTDLPPIRFHDLRHTHASLLGHAKVSSKVVQQRLGHKTHAITMDLYTKVFSEAHDEAAEALERLLKKA